MAKEKVKKQYLNGYERILKIDYMISHMHYPSVEDFARETEASIPTINRDLRQYVVSPDFCKNMDLA